MPLTFPAHQAAVVPLKLWRPRWFDGIALVVGAAAPDLLNAFHGFPSHHAKGALLSIGLTLLYASLLRRYAVDGLFGSLPESHHFRLKSLRVLQTNRPTLAVTATSAVVGVLSHVFVDSFAHDHSWAAQQLGLDSITFALPTGDMSGARLLWWTSHLVGSIFGIIFLRAVVAKGHIESWYGTETVERCRLRPLATHATGTTPAIIFAALAIGTAWGVIAAVGLIFKVGFCLAWGLLAAGVIAERGGSVQPNHDRFVAPDSRTNAHRPKTPAPSTADGH